MQTLSQIRSLLDAAGLRPRKALGQNFLVDQNLMRKLLGLADLRGDEAVLEVGPGTGSLTEELLERAGKVVAVELDADLARALAARLGGEEKLTLIQGDILAGKHRLSPTVLEALGERARLVANLPYNIATPLAALCLVEAWRACRGRSCGPQADSAWVRHGGTHGRGAHVTGGQDARASAHATGCDTDGTPVSPTDTCETPAVRTGTRFERLTFTVQREVADRLTAGPGGGEYGPASVFVALLGRVTPGPELPPEAFWPRPKVTSRMLRIDFDIEAAKKIADMGVLRESLDLAFSQRRKQIGSIRRRRDAGFDAAVLDAALAAAGIDPTARPEQVPPGQWLKLANILSADRNRQ